MLDEARIDILCLNESWLNQSISNDQIRIDEYKVYRLDRTVKRKGGGLCTYIYGTHKVNAHKYDELNTSNSDLEMLILEIQQKCTKPRVIISVYRPPQGNVTNCINTIKAAIKSIGPAVEICILGDLNVDYSDKSLAAKRELKTLEREYNLTQQISIPTRVTGTTNTLLDHMYTNLRNIAHSGIINTYLSDHFPTFIVIKKETVDLSELASSIDL